MATNEAKQAKQVVRRTAPERPQVEADTVTVQGNRTVDGIREREVVVPDLDPTQTFVPIDAVDLRVEHTLDNGMDPGAGPEVGLPGPVAQQLKNRGYAEYKQGVHAQVDADYYTGANQVGGGPLDQLTNPAGYALGAPQARVGSGDIAADPSFIEAMVQAAVQKLMSERTTEEERSLAVQQVSNPQQFARSLAEPAPERFKQHFRNDTFPNIVIQEMDFSTDEPQRNPIRGSYLRFRRGHFFATTDNQVAQLTWMMNNPEYDPASPDPANARVVGGLPSIYVHDESDVAGCPYGCENVYFVPGSNSHKSHMRSAHGVEI